MNESNVWQTLKQGLTDKCLMTRIESSAGNGVPDVIVHSKIGHIFIELKYIESYPKRESTQLKLPLRPEQRLWINTRGNLSGNVWVFVRVEDDFYLLPYFVAIRLCDGWVTEQWKRIPHWTKKINFNDLYAQLIYKEEK